MKRIRERSAVVQAALVLGLLALVAAPARAALDAEEVFAPAAAAAFPDEIRGTVTFNGCVVPAAQLAVRAVPLGEQSDDGVVFPPGRSTVKMARVTATADPHVLSFSIRGLASRAPYQIGIKYPPNPCGKVFWRGLARGLALPGLRPLKLEGFAAQTQVELLSRETGGFVGADELEFTDAAQSQRVLRWKSLIPGVTRGELQLSTEPFPREGRFGTCDEPRTGVFYRQSVPAGLRGRWQALDPIDFAPLLAPAGRAGGEPVPGLTPIGAREHGLLLLGAPVYARVVPVVGDAVACDTRRHGVAGWALLGRRPKGDFDLPGDSPDPPLLVTMGPQTYTPPYLGGPGQGHPTFFEDAFRLIKPHTFPSPAISKMTPAQYWFFGVSDPIGTMLVANKSVAPGTTWTPDPGNPTWLYFVPMNHSDDGGFLSDFMSLGGNLVTGLFSAFGSFVDFMATMTEQIKTSLAKAVVDVATIVPGVSEACGALQSAGTSCEAVVKAGMEYGLASMGLPPSLPNWQELQDQGIEYLAAEVATAVGDPTGLSAQLTEQMLNDMVTSTLDRIGAARPGVAKTIDWLVPYLGFEPAVWKVSVFNGDPLNYHPQSTYIRVKTGGSLFQAVNVHVPERFPPGGLVRIPVVLQPSPEGIYAPRCRLSVIGQISCEPIWWSKKPVCEIPAGFSGGGSTWKKVDCAAFNWDEIYYRDAWVAQKLFPTACVFLGGYSAGDASGLWLPNPNPPFTDSAYLPPLAPASWDGPAFISPLCP